MKQVLTIAATHSICAQEQWSRIQRSGGFQPPLFTGSPLFSGWKPPLRVLTICIVMSLTGIVPGDHTPVGLPSSESLGDKLLEDLGPDLFKDVPAFPDPSATEQQVRPRSTPDITPQPSSGKPLFRKWSDRAGEDIGTGGNHSPVNEIITGMRAAQALIAQRDGSGQTSDVQQKVVADLDALIAALNQQQSQVSQDNSQDEPQQSRRSQRSAAKPRPTAGRGGQAAAQDSTARLDEGEADDAQTTTVHDILKELWGHLPGRVREQLLQSPADEFLPKYQLELEQYFRRLAEEGARDDRRPLE